MALDAASGERMPGRRTVANPDRHRPLSHPAQCARAAGREILTGLMQHLRFEDILDEVRQSATVIPVMMPYV